MCISAVQTRVLTHSGAARSLIIPNCKRNKYVPPPTAQGPRRAGGCLELKKVENFKNVAARRNGSRLAPHTRGGVRCTILYSRGRRSPAILHANVAISQAYPGHRASVVRVCVSAHVLCMVAGPNRRRNAPTVCGDRADDAHVTPHRESHKQNLCQVGAPRTYEKRPKSRLAAARQWVNFVGTHHPGSREVVPDPPAAGDTGGAAWARSARVRCA